MKKFVKKAAVVRLFLAITLSLTSVLANSEYNSCYCKIKVGNQVSPVRSLHFSDLKECHDYLKEQRPTRYWDNFCSDTNLINSTLSCAQNIDTELQIKTRCLKVTDFQSFLFHNPTSFTASNEQLKTKLPKVTNAFNADLQSAQYFNFRRSYSDIALFIEQTPGLNLSNALYGGIYDASSGLRIDLSIFDILLQVDDLLKGRFEKLYAKYKTIIAQEPIKNFPKFFRWFDNHINTNSKIKRASKRLITQLYTEDSLALQADLKLLSSARVYNPRYSNSVRLYNRIVTSVNRTAIFKKIHQELAPSTITPFSRELISSLDKKAIEELISQVHMQEHNLRVQALKSQDPAYEYQFALDYENGNSHLLSAIKKGPSATAIDNRLIQTYNYIHTRLDESFLRELLNKKSDDPFSLSQLSPKIINNNIDIWVDVIREHSWSTQISYGNDMTLLVFRDWMKNNRKEILEAFSKYEIDPLLQEEIKNWRPNRRPSRSLTLDCAQIIYKEFPNHEWESHFILDQFGQKYVLGESKLKDSIRSATSVVQRLIQIENVASTVASGAVMASTGNMYLSAITTTLVHDFITAKKYGYDIKDYMLAKTPTNLASAFILSFGYTPGRLADAIFRGGLNGAYQAVVTGKSIKYGILVGGITGGILQQLPPEASNWTIKGEDKDVLNIFSELAEQTFFKSMQGAAIGYFEDGNWQDGLRDGAIYGAATASIKMVVFGVRYDANSYISDEEIAEYNHLHNHEDGHFTGEHLDRDTSVMADRYGDELTITRDDVLRANFRQGGFLTRLNDGALGTNYSNPLFSEITISPEATMREETLLHEVMHTRQMQLGRMSNLLARLGPNKVPEGFWEEYIDVGHATLPKGFYKTYIYVHLDDVL